MHLMSHFMFHLERDDPSKFLQIIDDAHLNIQSALQKIQILLQKLM